MLKSWWTLVAVSLMLTPACFAEVETAAPEAQAEEAGETIADAAAPDETAAPSPDAKSLGLVVIGEVDEDVVTSVADHLKVTLLCEVAVLEARAATGADNLQAEAEALADVVGEHDGVVALAQVADTVQGHGAFLPQQKVGLVSVTGLSVGVEGDEVGTRLLKEATHCGGMLVGLARCPNSRCALWQYKNDEGLAFKGAGLCPPCQKQARRLAGVDG